MLGETFVVNDKIKNTFITSQNHPSTNIKSMQKYAQNSVVLLNIAHTDRCPKRVEGAAIRILGVFLSVEHLQMHASKYYTADLDLIAIPLRKWVAILQSCSSDIELQHLEKLGLNYKAKEARHEEEFRENVTQRRTGKVKPVPQKFETGILPAVTPDGLQEAPDVPREAELRLQSVAIISILPDIETSDTAEQQPGLLVWGAYETVEAAREHIKTELALIARDVHLDTVSMYEWIPLTNIDLQHIREEFRDDSLTDIMQARKEENIQVEQYKELCKQRGQEPNVLDITTPHQELSLPDPLERQTAIPNLLSEEHSHATC